MILVIESAGLPLSIAVLFWYCSYRRYRFLERVRVRGVSMFSIVFRIAAATAISLAVVSGAADAQQDRRQNQPGKFDFYVLSLSWRSRLRSLPPAG